MKHATVILKFGDTPNVDIFIWVLLTSLKESYNLPFTHT